jgi:hypothetical protein
MVLLRVGTYNAWRESTAAGVRADMLKLLPQVDVIGLQESYHWINVLRDVGREFGFELLVPDGPAQARNNPILYRTSVLRPAGQLVTELGSPKSKIARLTPARYINWMRFYHNETKRYVCLFNTHFNQHVEFRGRPRPLPRVRLYARHMKVLTTMMHRRAANRVVLATADWNVNAKSDKGYRWFPRAAMAEIHARSNYAALGFPSGGGTDSFRFIDAVFAVNHPFYRFVEQKIIRGLNSDHNALITTIQINPL